MRLDQVLARIGVEIVKSEPTKTKVVLFLRAGRKPQHIAQWKRTIEEYLSAEAEQREKSWSCDISRSYYLAQAKAVKYLWRVIITGDVRTGAESFGQAALRSLSAGGAEVMSMPLVGQVNYEFNPAEGKMKGGHPPDRARAAVTLGMSGGNVQ